MNNGFHGSDAIQNCGDHRWCVSRNGYESPPGKHMNITRPLADRKRRIIFDVRATPLEDVPRHEALFFSTRRTKTLPVLLDSGATASIFTAASAELLEIVDQIRKAKIQRRVTDVTGEYVILPEKRKQFMVLRRVPLWVWLGRVHQRIEVWWPFDLVENEVIIGFPADGNILGMKDVLSNNLLCLTPETVYVFPSRERESGALRLEVDRF